MRSKKRSLAIVLKNEYQYKDEQLYKTLCVVYNVEYCIIDSDFTMNSNSWVSNFDILLVPKEFNIEETILLPLLELFLNTGKEVWCYRNISDFLRSSLNKFGNFKYSNIFLQDSQDKSSFKTAAPVIFIYGNSMYASQNYVNLKLCNAFEKIGAKVLSLSVDYYAEIVNQISLSDIYNHDYSVIQKQNVCLKILQEVEEKYSPDVYIISIPQSSSIPDNHIKGNEILESIVVPDYIICSLINYDYNQAYIDKLERSGINGMNIDYYYLSDNSINILSDKIEIIHTGWLNRQDTLSIIKKNKQVFNKLIEGYDDSEFEKVVNDFVNKFSKNKYVLI